MSSPVKNVAVGMLKDAGLPQPAWGSRKPDAVIVPARAICKAQCTRIKKMSSLQANFVTLVE